eukprot:scaffold4419_cov416-Prasinococcus_capsulatus_cf.AAC.2
MSGSHPEELPPALGNPKAPTSQRTTLKRSLYHRSSTEPTSCQGAHLSAGNHWDCARAACLQSRP